jgi:hypothetical protein
MLLKSRVFLLPLLFFIPFLLAKTLGADPLPLVTDPETKEYFKSEEPLTQKDLDFYLKALPLFTDENAEALIGSLAEAEGFPKERIRYALIKTGITYLLLENPYLEEDIPDFPKEPPFLPLDEEKTLVREYMERINKSLKLAE